ncbi:hypothetical protein I7I51_06548 [Histoplasma capsulatum]|uniref:Uncharacterized protein n=1 Tax=Ajellomyces capsulatus TaxID=5037 RepID=A0A8A1MKQ2_AJECA|nr:predicted protein [Histoplasma mississippiense (nom. inval.)]EDN06166.1 predicted protein [Histoplasma mississippiense (nom. inval.)]QSS65700.1 hypothetical protein I7I51_06548 [Histoplasma capsulatum]
MYSRPSKVLTRGSLFFFIVLAFLITLLWHRRMADNHGVVANPWNRHASRQHSPTLANLSLGSSKPPGSNHSRALIIPRLQREDADWVSTQLVDVEAFVYVVDDPHAPLHSPLNKGHEAMVYLTYLIDHYDNLPDIMIFMHSHRIGWHNEHALAMDAVAHINRLSSERVTREGYMNLRCNWDPGCPAWLHPGKTEADTGKPEEANLATAWRALFPGIEVPEVLAQACCAQFAISRARARAIPRARYVFYRDWILRTELSDSISGRVWEYLWQVLFAGQTVFCPAKHVCYCDGYGLCFGGAKGVGEYLGLLRREEGLKKDLEKWRRLAGVVADAEREGKSRKEIENMEQPELGKGALLEAQLEAAKQELMKIVARAQERGRDPRIRAQEAGREWKEGDGF